MKIIKKLAKI